MCVFYQDGDREHYTGAMAACVKSDPVSVPKARHDLRKSCLPLAGAAVFKISLKTHPRWPRAAHFLHTANPVHAPLEGLVPTAWRYLIDHVSSGLWGFSPHPFCPFGNAISLRCCRVLGGGSWGPERALTEWQSAAWSLCPGLRLCRSRCSTFVAGPAHLLVTCQPAALWATALGRWGSCGLSLAPNKLLGSAPLFSVSFAHLALCCQPA